MAILLKISQWISTHITIVIVAVSALALFVPSSCIWISTKAINPLLGIVMFGMGLTLKPADFKLVFTRPKDIITGCLAQFTIMPFLAWLLCRLFSLPTELAIGVILVGCCPGGTASNVITYLAKGDVPLSVGMTTVSTILAPLLTPFLTYLLAGKSIDVDVMGMFISILQVVILPIVAGLIIDYYFGKFTKRIMAFLPMVSTITIAIIIACVISHNAQKILECTLLIWGVVILHNLLGFGLGYTVGKLLKLPKPKRNAIAIEVGMQNSGLATSLATTHFALYPMAAIPGAIFSVWHNFSGSIAASIFRRGI